MENDDHPIGRLLSRREAIRMLAAAGAGLLSGLGSDASGATVARGRPKSPCVVRPELTEGPYFVDEQLERSDIRPEPSDGSIVAGVPLALEYRVSRLGSAGCTPLAGAIVDVWHCDARGVYSGVSDRGLGFETVGRKFLRGFQRTDANGAARFASIFPGWYPGRTVHVHFKIRTTLPKDRTWEFTSQLFFDDAITRKVHGLEPYVRNGQPDTTNRADGIYRAGGDRLLVPLQPVGRGYGGAFEIALDLSDAEVGAADGRRRGRRRGA